MTAETTQALHAAILAAHEAGDGPRLAALYGEAADAFSDANNIDAACFFYTQAFIFALEVGAGEAERYAAVLRSHGRL